MRLMSSIFDVISILESLQDQYKSLDQIYISLVRYRKVANFEQNTVAIM